MDFEQIVERLEELNNKATDLEAKLPEAADEESRKAVADQLEELNGKVQELTEARDAALAEKHQEEMLESVKSVRAQLEELRKPAVSLFGDATGNSDESPYAGKAHSFFGDLAAIWKGRDNDGAARERIQAVQELQGKALREGNAAAGGYLVDPDIQGGLIELRDHATPLQGIIPSVSTNSDQVQLSRVDTGTTVAFADELATKTGSDMAFSQFTESIFTAAGLATISNQLLADANPAVDQLAIRDLGVRLGILREKTYINGSGTGEPTGILNTSGIVSNPYTDATPTAGELLDAIALLIADVQETGKTDISHIVLHPKTWTTLITAKESDGHYTLGVGPGDPERRATDNLPVRTLYGYPVVLTFHMPTNLGAGTNETRVIVGNFPDALRLEREGVRVDQSEHVYFTSNQTVFRVEERYGFTAARYPESFGVLEGTGLIVS